MAQLSDTGTEENQRVKATKSILTSDAVSRVLASAKWQCRHDGALQSHPAATVTITNRAVPRHVMCWTAPVCRFVPWNFTICRHGCRTPMSSFPAVRQWLEWPAKSRSSIREVY